jgi:DNA-binding protein HU-beta
MNNIQILEMNSSGRTLIIQNVAAGKRISMLGFGTFKLTHRKARKGRNPKTGEEIQIKASNTPSFSAGKSFKEKCNE